MQGSQGEPGETGLIGQAGPSVSSELIIYFFLELNSCMKSNKKHRSCDEYFNQKCFGSCKHVGPMRLSTTTTF